MLIVSCEHEAWLEQVMSALRYAGCAVVTDVLDEPFLEQTRSAMCTAQRLIRDEVGEERLANAGELGVLRLMVLFDDHFLRFLELPQVLEVVDVRAGD